MYQKIQTYQRVPQMGTSLPSSPQNGDQFLLVDSMSAPTYQWLLQYVAAKASNKWVFIGGAPSYNDVATTETTAASAYTALATAGPSFTAPVAGIYLVEIGAFLNNNTGSGVMYASYDVGATSAVDADAALCWVSATSQGASVAKRSQKTLSGSAAIAAKYRVTAGTGSFAARWLSVVPVALGG